ncbi:MULTISPECIES: RES family NAD+ phosphorylase [unclassified Sphingomonas]|uniref:RES family NAD+ phosphorylase n=1 Tax=unclassified Sphingomonas TaxID=196159 RepID=UPI00082E5FF5|nr:MULTISPECIES: RES family NAD+ phosphorylase [unclassified Sphingomonas]
MIAPGRLARTQVEWNGAVRIIRSLYPPIDLFEDIADPADWPLLIAAEQKTNPRLMETIGALDLVPPGRRVAGPGASYLMAPFTHASTDRPSRFTDGSYGVLYAGNRFRTALLETIHHHARFMARTREAPGWTSQFREILLDIRAELHDLRGRARGLAEVLDPADHTAARRLGAALRASGSDGIVYPSLRDDGGECVGLFYPDLAHNPRQGRHLDYHWDGARVDLYRDAGSGEVFRIVETDEGLGAI